MTECIHRARTSAYFDGALPEAEQAGALFHIETCAQCQELLRNAATFAAVISSAPATVRAAPGARRRRWLIAPAFLRYARLPLAEIHRHLDRASLARAELEEIVLAGPDCDVPVAQVRLAYLAFAGAISARRAGHCRDRAPSLVARRVPTRSG